MNGQELLSRRKAAGLSQEGLARLADISTSTVAKAESMPGRRMSKLSVRALEAAFDRLNRRAHAVRIVEKPERRKA